MIAQTIHNASSILSWLADNKFVQEKIVCSANDITIIVKKIHIICRDDGAIDAMVPSGSDYSWFRWSESSADLVMDLLKA